MSFQRSREHIQERWRGLVVVHAARVQELRAREPRAPLPGHRDNVDEPDPIHRPRGGMSAPSSVAAFADVLADLALDLRRGSCCLVVCDKGWTLPLFVALKERLKAANVKCGYLDGRPSEESPNDAGVMLSTV